MAVDNMKCKLCGNPTHRVQNGNFKWICDDCLIKRRRKEDHGKLFSKSRYMIECSRCHKDYSINYISFFHWCKKVASGKIPFCDDCKFKARHERAAKDYICQECGKATQNKVTLLCDECLRNYRSPESIDAPTRKKAIYLYPCEKEGCKTIKPMAYEVFHRVLQRKAEEPGWEYWCRKCSYSRLKKTKPAKTDEQKSKSILMHGCKLFRGKKGFSRRDNYCLLYCEHRQECRDKIVTLGWDSWTRKRIQPGKPKRIKGR